MTPMTYDGHICLVTAVIVCSYQTDGWIILARLPPPLWPSGHHVQPAETPPGREEARTL